MKNVEFQNKVEQWLLEQGYAKIEKWLIETEENANSVRITVELKVCDILVKAVCNTSNDENAIQNAVLSLNEKIVQRLDSEANKIAEW